MPADQYRLRAFEAHQRGEQAPDFSVKAGWERLAQDWLVLAKQAEWFQQRYGKEVVQQQQQVEPKNDGQ
jgi:hypothetical protein